MDDKKLLKLLKEIKPPFGTIEYDEIIFAALLRRSSSSSSSSSYSSSSSSSPSKKLIVLCGPPGSGKSTIKKSLLEEQGITNYIDIDPDEIRTILMAHSVTFNNVDTMRGITNEFNKRMSDHALKTGLNIVFDTTGQNFRQVSSLLSDSKGEGYETTFAVIWASWETCERRVNRRNTELKKSGSGRITMDIGVAETIYNAFMEKGVASNYLIQYPVRADKVLLYNNDIDGGDPVLLFNKEKGTVIKAEEFSGFYDMDLHADGSITKISDAISSSSKKGAGKRKTKRVTYRKNKRSKTKRQLLSSFHTANQIIQRLNEYFIIIVNELIIKPFTL